METNLHVIFGAGPLGIATANSLVKRGQQVKLVSRSGKSKVQGAESVAVDVLDFEAAKRVAQGAFALYNCTNAPYEKWDTLMAPLFRAVRLVAEAVGSRLIVGDNLYMIGPNTQLMTEESPIQPVSSKSKIRAEIQAENLASSSPVALVRGSDYFGPGVENAYLGARAMKPLLSGGKIMMIGNLDRKHSFTYVPDMGEALATLGTADTGWEGIWHAPTLPAISPREMLQRAATLAGKPLKVSAPPTFVFNLLGVFMPMMKELRQTYYQWDQDFEMSSRKIEKAFGLRPTPLDEALKVALASY